MAPTAVGIHGPSDFYRLFTTRGRIKIPFVECFGRLLRRGEFPGPPSECRAINDAPPRTAETLLFVFRGWLRSRLSLKKKKKLITVEKHKSLRPKSTIRDQICRNSLTRFTFRTAHKPHSVNISHSLKRHTHTRLTVTTTRRVSFLHFLRLESIAERFIRSFPNFRLLRSDYS